MLNVLHIITGLNDGGAEGLLYRLCAYDKKSKHTVVSMMDEGKYAPLLREAGIVVHCLGMPRGRVTVRGLLELRRLLKAHRPDVVQTWMYHADLIGGLVARFSCNAPVCWGIRNSTLMRGVSAFSTILAAKICALLSGFVPRVIICCSRKAAEVHHDLGYSAEKMVCIPNGYDIGLFSPDREKRSKIRNELKIEDKIPLLGMVARFDPQKDHENLLKALGVLKRSGRNFRCALVGTNMTCTNQSMQEIIQKEQLTNKILLIGRRNDIPAIMNALDLHILSSSFGEAFPNVLAEAMACGTPCVTTDVGDAAFIVGESGWIVPPKDPNALAKAIEIAMEERTNAEQWSKRTAAARERIAANFEIGAVVEMYQECWKNASGAKQAKPKRTDYVER